MRLITSSSMALLLVCIMCVPDISAQCTGTVVAGGSHANEIWTLCGSPYQVTGTIFADNLVIEAGVVVQCDPGVAINVTTLLTTLGTAVDPVTLTATTPTGTWSGLKFQNGSAASVLQHTVIEKSNQAGAFILDTDVTFQFCNIRDNTNGPVSLAGCGGGLRIVLNSSKTVRIEDSIIQNNRSQKDGGGISAVQSTGTVVVERCSIVGNTCGDSNANLNGYGGGLGFSGPAGFGTTTAGGGVTLVTSCLISGNKARGRGNYAGCFVCGLLGIYSIGAGIGVNGGTHAFTTCEVRDNINEVSSTGGGSSGTDVRAFALGSGIYTENNAAVAIEGSVFSGGTAFLSGGANSSDFRAVGVYNGSGTVAISNSVIARMPQQGIRNDSGTVTAQNTIVYFNSGCTLTACNASTQIIGLVFASFCNVQGGYATGVGNIGVNPSFVGTGTTAADFVLSANSACIDAGNPASAWDDACRPPGLGGTRNDIGCYGGPTACLWAANLPPIPNSLRPGTAEDLVLTTGISAALTATPDVKDAVAGDLLQINVSTPLGTFFPGPLVIAAQLFSTGSTLGSIFPAVHINPNMPAFVIVYDGTISPFGNVQPIPPGGLGLAFVAPSFPGLSVIFQGFALTFDPIAYSVPAQNGIFAATDAHEIRFH